jgi:hypothetical protein
MDAKQRSFAVVMPKPEEDRPSWGRVGVIAAVGFVIGIAWPRVAGVKLGPSAPNEGDKSAAAAQAASANAAPPPASLTAPTKSASQPIASAAAPASAAPSASANAAMLPPDVTVGRGTILNCKNDDGEQLKGADCGNGLKFDAVASARLGQLSQCSAALGTTGKLSAVLSLDFKSGFVGVDIGKSSTVTNQDSLSACLKTEMHGLNIAGVAHEHPKYTVVYHVTFSAPSAGGGTAGAVSPADNTPAAPISENAPTAQVGWEVALVRDTPKTGQIVARLPRGSKVRVGSPKDGWYRIQYGNTFGSEGWVYRGAIGK